MKKLLGMLIPLALILSFSMPVSAAWKFNPYTKKMDYYQSSADLGLDDLVLNGAGIDDEAYGAAEWDGDTTLAPSKNAVRDKIESLSTVYQPLEATLTDIADGTIAENLVNTANPWADNEVADTLTIGASSTVANGALDADLQALASGITGVALGLGNGNGYQALQLKSLALTGTTLGLGPVLNMTNNTDQAPTGGAFQVYFDNGKFTVNQNGVEGLPGFLGDANSWSAEQTFSSYVQLGTSSWPGSPDNGQFGYDGTHLYFQHGATLTDLLAAGHSAVTIASGIGAITVSGQELSASSVIEAISDLSNSAGYLKNDGSGNFSYDTPATATASSLHVDDILTAIGIASEAVNLGTFTGTTINDSVTVKAALQALETAVEGVESGGLADIDDLPGDTTDDNLIDAALLADLSATYTTTGHTHAYLASADINTESELETILSSINLIVSTEIDSAAELNALLGVTISTSGHTHTGTTISSIDISDDTNLAGTTNEITLTGDTLSLAAVLDLSGKTLTLPAYTQAAVANPALTHYDSDAPGTAAADKMVAQFKSEYVSGTVDHEVSSWMLAAMVDGTITDIFWYGGASDTVYSARDVDVTGCVYTSSGIDFDGGAAPTMNSAGRLDFDTTITGWTGGALVWTPDGTNIRYIVDIPSGSTLTDGHTPHWDTSTNGWVLEADATGEGGGLANVVEDLSPELGADLLMNTHAITGANAASYIALGADPADSGAIRLSNNTALAWEQSTPGTDIFIALDGSDILQVGQNAANIYLGTSGTGNVTVTGDLTVTGSDINVGAAGVKLTGDGDGAITFLGLGDGSDEDLTINLDDTANTAKFSSSTGVTTMDFSALNLVTTGQIHGGIEIISDDTGLDASQCYGSLDKTNGAEAITLPAAVVGMNVVIYSDDATVKHIDPNGTDTIVLTTTALTAGYQIESPGAAGDFIALVCMTANQWTCMGRSGIWVTHGAD